MYLNFTPFLDNVSVKIVRLGVLSINYYPKGLLFGTINGKDIR